MNGSNESGTAETFSAGQAFSKENYEVPKPRPDQNEPEACRFSVRTLALHQGVVRIIQSLRLCHMEANKSIKESESLFQETLEAP
jgi:hypothetical protein